MNNEGIIIVYEKKGEKFANFLSQLISSYTKHEVAVWEVKHWDSNKPSVNSLQKIIFLGGAGDAYNIGMEYYYNNFSMKYGWLGNRCSLDVDLIDLGEVSSFKKFYKERSAHFKHIAEKDTEEGVVGKVLLSLLEPALLGFLSLVDWFLLDRVKLKKYQYQLLICEFIFEGGFKKFMEI